jgi:hypothetical protein
MPIMTRAVLGTIQLVPVSMSVIPVFNPPIACKKEIVAAWSEGVVTDASLLRICGIQDQCGQDSHQTTIIWRFRSSS